MYIFLDESGDLGFDFSKPGTSKKFTIALLICENAIVYKNIKSAVKKTLARKINVKNKKMKVDELKGSNSSLAAKQYFLNLMPPSGWYIYAITVKKEKIHNHLRTKNVKNKLYNFVTKELFTSLNFPKSIHQVSLVVDKCKNGADRTDFNAYIKTHLENTFKLDTKIHIEHENSHNSPGLQAVDIFCWGIQAKENGNDDWHKLFGNKITKHIKWPYSKKNYFNKEPPPSDS